jgi:integrase
MKPPKESKKLTKSYVESRPLPLARESNKDPGQELYWDSELRGFGVRITPTGKRTYIVQGRVNGKSFRETLGTHGVLTCDEARKKARARLVAYDEGVDPKAEKKLALTAAMTLREVAEDYCKNKRTTKGGKLTALTVRDIDRHIKTNFGDWIDKPVAGITSEMCRDRFEKISARSESQANQAFRILRALINFSIDEENPRPNPVRTLNKGRWNPNKAKTGYIPLDRVGAVWNLLQNKRTDKALLPSGRTGADIVTFILLSGCRWNEAAELTWDCINMDAGNWHIADPKNHNPVTFPLSEPALALLTARPRIKDNPYVCRVPHQKWQQ